MHKSRLAFSRIAVGLTFVAVISSCSDSSSTSDSAEATDPTESSVVDSSTEAPTTTEMDHSSDETSYPLTIDNCGYTLTFDKAPERVLILNGTSVAEVETMIALGLEDHILANSQSYGQSDVAGMVDKIAALPTGGLSLNENYEVPKEQTLALEPDLVISTWAGGFRESIGSVTREELQELGINSYVNPVNCAYGSDNPRPEDQEIYDNQSYEDSFRIVEDFGKIFNVQHEAGHFIEDAKADIESVAKPEGEPKKVLVAYPGMGVSPEAPMIFAGPFVDSIISAAGGVNAFPGVASFNDGAMINAEALAAADVDVLMVGLFFAGEDAAAYAKQIFELYPQWTAAKNNAFVAVSDSFYLGPYNSIGIAKIADALQTSS